MAELILVDHVIVLNEGHLRRLLREFLAYYHEDRTHLSLGKDPPARPAMSPRPEGLPMLPPPARLLIFLLFTLPASVEALTVVVDTTADDPALTACDDAVSNDCSLRGAILAANGRPH